MRRYVGIGLIIALLIMGFAALAVWLTGRNVYFVAAGEELVGNLFRDVGLPSSVTLAAQANRWPMSLRWFQVGEPDFVITVWR